MWEREGAVLLRKVSKLHSGVKLSSAKKILKKTTPKFSTKGILKMFPDRGCEDDWRGCSGSKTCWGGATGGYIVSGGRGKVLRSPVSSAEYWLSKLLVWKFPETVGLTRTFTATTTQLQAGGLKPKSQRDSCWEFSRLRHGRWFFYRRRVHFLRKKKKSAKAWRKKPTIAAFPGKLFAD